MKLLNHLNLEQKTGLKEMMKHVERLTLILELILRLKC